MLCTDIIQNAAKSLYFTNGLRLVIFNIIQGFDSASKKFRSFAFGIFGYFIFISDLTRSLMIETIT